MEKNYAQSGLQQHTTSPAISPPRLPEVVKCLDERVSHARELASRLRTALDRVLGAIPEGASTGEKASIPTSFVGSIETYATELYSAHVDIADQVMRLEHVIG